MSFEELWGIENKSGVVEHVDTIDNKPEPKLNVDATKIMKICAGCEKEFEPKRKNQKYCSPTCRVREARHRWKIRKESKHGRK